MLKNLLPLLLILLTGCASTVAPPQPAPTPAAWAHLPIAGAGNGIVPPKVIRRVDPQMTREFRRSRSDARATVEAVVDEQGKVADVWYVEGDERWAWIVAFALRKWEFEPATLDGKPIAVRFKMSSSVKITSYMP